MFLQIICGIIFLKHNNSAQLRYAKLNMVYIPVIAKNGLLLCIMATIITNTAKP
jgi:hypothetical protein